MKIVDAFWEKRNFGVDTTEFTIENEDKINNVLEALNNCTSKYQVLRLPSHMTEFIFEIQKIGFVFVEDIFTLRNDLKPVEMNPITQRIYNAVSYAEMNEEDFNELLKEIKKGIFDSDRVFIDPLFKNEDALNRYYNWLKDEKERGALFYKFVYKSNTIGFVAFKNDGQDNYYGFLAGVYSDYKKSGLGSVIYGIDIIRDIKGKSIISVVSSNNTKQLKNVISQGFKIESSYHVFVKHI